MFFGMLVLVSVFAVKTLFLAILGWRQAAFVWGLQSDLSNRLFAGYLRQPYTFHMQRNSAQLIRNTMGHVADFATVLQQSLVLVTEVLVLVGVSALLISVEPRGALAVMGTLGFFSWAFYYSTRRRLLRWGEAHQHHEGLRIQHLQQGLGGIKEVKLYGREDLFLSQYQVHNAGSARARQGWATLVAFPRLFLEFIAVAGLGWPGPADDRTGKVPGGSVTYPCVVRSCGLSPHAIREPYVICASDHAVLRTCG